MDIQSMNSSTSGRLNSLDQASGSIYSQRSKQFNPFYPGAKDDNKSLRNSS